MDAHVHRVHVRARGFVDDDADDGHGVLWVQVCVQCVHACVLCACMHACVHARTHVCMSDGDAEGWPDSEQPHVCLMTVLYVCLMFLMVQT